MKIQGSVALVTGANRGLGSALVSALVEAGAGKVYAAARDESKLPKLGSRVVPLTLDVTKPEQIAAAAKSASDITLLVNNAGVLTAYNVLTMSQAEIDADFRTNVFGTLGVIRGFLPVLERAPDGATILNVLSLVSLAPSPGLGGYSSSKAAAYSMTQAMRPELKKKGIEILAALPGLIDTDMVRALPAPKASAADVAKGIVAGIGRGEEDIFPDAPAQHLGAVWNKSHKEYERTFASF
jgi:NAD(P)-dependent dehydrogenase (short-subunit alcohol dehydrogenase family)